MPLREITKAIFSGSTEDVRNAHCTLLRLRTNPKNRRQLEEYLKLVIDRFSFVPDIIHQVAAAGSLRWLVNDFGVSHYRLCRDFILKLLKHPDGRLRQQAVYLSEYLGGAMVLRTAPRKDTRALVLDFAACLNTMIHNHGAYAPSMPPSPIKSANLALDYFRHTPFVDETLLLSLHQ